MKLPDKDYNGLKEILKNKESWPGNYMFKFIVPASNKNMAKVESLFNSDARIYRKESKNAKYLSITVEDTMVDPEHVISIYKKAEQIPDIIIL